MAKKPEPYSSSDRNAARTSMPGTKRQTPTETYTISVGGKPISTTTMNYDGVAGGEPTNSRRELRTRKSAYEKAGNTASAKAADIRINNLKGHEDMTGKSMDEIERRMRDSAKGRREARMNLRGKGG